MREIDEYKRRHAHKEEMDMDEYDSDYGIYAWGAL